MPNKPLRIGGTPLAVQVLEIPPYVIGQWVGTGPETTRETVLEASGELLTRAGEHLVLDFSRFINASELIIVCLARCISEAQRLGREVCLVRCAEDLFRRLQRSGAGGTIIHAGSLLAATHGLIGAPAKTLDLHLRSTPDHLRRLRDVVTVIARQAGLSGVTEMQLKTAITEAAANAIVHGSPEGTRNHVRISFHLDAGLLIVDVADQGPGFDPGVVPAPVPTELREHGYGLYMMRQSVDRVEFYRDDRGMLVRMTKFLQDGQVDWAQ